MTPASYDYFKLYLFFHSKFDHKHLIFKILDYNQQFLKFDVKNFL